MEDTNSCPVCYSNNIKILHKHTFKFPGNEVEDHIDDGTYTRLWILFEKIIKNKTSINFKSMLCKSCGFIFTNPRFSENDFKIKYNTINELGEVKKRIKRNPPSNLEPRAKRVYNLILNFSYENQSNCTKLRILDYGGASGYILKPFISIFDCYLLDYEKWDLPQGVKYLGNDLTDLKETERFDIILCLHTLEHVIYPRKFLGDLSKHLNHQGIIYVEVPLGCFREYKSLTEPLTHINFFSEESLFNCFNFCGLNVIHLSTSYQWVYYNKFWCLNIIGTKNDCIEKVKMSDVLSTYKQMKKFSYYLPYYRKVFKQLRGV